MAYTREDVEKQLACVEEALSFKPLAQALVISLVCLWVGYSLIETHWYEGTLPEALETTGFATTGSDLQLFDLLMPVPVKVCGGAAFSLTRRTLAAIATRGLPFFDQARRPRGDPRNRPRLAYDYAQWRETPVPSGWTSDGPWAGLACMGGTWSGVNIYDAAREPGSYYTERPGAQLLVVPRFGIAVFTYRD
jgi:hypothetical protein